MIAEILAVGTELLMGQIANTNAQYISGRLPDVGVSVYYHSVVGDNPNRLKEALSLALKRSDVVIMTGGLGPTQDDLTKETVAEAFGRKLVLNEESLERLKRHFARTNRVMTENNLKQANMPEGAIVLQNNNGTAPGCILEEGNKAVIMMPGPPREMKPMFEDGVIPYFRSKAEYRLVSRFLRIIGVGESALEMEFKELFENQTNPTIAPYVKEGEVTLRITAKCSGEAEGEAMIEPVARLILDKLGSKVYSIDDRDLEEIVGELLIKNNITVSLAESCTGGMIAARLTDIPGISKVFNRGFVTYSNEAKIENLGVNPVTLQKHGAVSRETAIEMAKGVRALAGTDIGLAVTGIAGPDGGTAEKPVGLVYVALADKHDTICKELRLTGNRARIRNSTVVQALNLIRLYIIDRENM